MHYHIITIFPEIFESFLNTSLISKAQEKWLIQVSVINPRDFCTDKHQQIDDEIYGGGAGMLIKAEPIIESIKDTLSRFETQDLRLKKVKVVLLGPSKDIFTQETAHSLVDDYEHIIFICGRYEGIDHRVQLRCEKEFDDDFSVVSLGQFVTLGGEVPAMSMIEATARLIPWVIKEEVSRQDESYRPEQWMNNLEYPQYTRPEEIEWFSVPEVLLSGHHAEIEKWREESSESV